MAKVTQYTIAYWRNSFAPTASTLITKRTAPAAAASLYNEVYAMLESDGALASKRAHELVKEVTNYAVKPEPGEAFKSRKFHLREDDLDSPFVRIESTVTY